MGSIKRVLVCWIFLTIPILVFGQSNLEDVVYLKDGSIYRGLIIEQVPNVSLKIQIVGGNVFAVQLSDVQKMTKEQKHVAATSGSHNDHNRWQKLLNDTTPFTPKKRGYFLEAQVLLENIQGGIHVINGYKFGRLGYLGIGVGFDYIFSSPFNPKINGLEKKALAGLYLPLHLYYSGDILKKRFTPYYTIEAGYVMAFKGLDGKYSTDEAGRRALGGPMGGVGFGLKFNAKRHKGHFSLLFNLNYKYIRFERDVPILTGGIVTGTFTSESTAHLLFPGIRFGIGF